MLTLAQLPQMPSHLSNSLIAQTPLWQRDIRKVSALDLTVFLRFHKGKQTSYQAIREVDAVKEAIALAYSSGMIKDEDANALSHSFEPSIFTTGDLLEWLSCASVVRRRALLFALEMNLMPRKVIDLTWKDLPKMQLTELASQVVSASVRHIKLPYVFWETTEKGLDTPLFGLHETMLEVTQGLGMTVFRRLYERMILVDADAELKAFQQSLAETAQREA